MTRLANIIIKHQKTAIFIYIILILASIVASTFVEVNYDLSLYLPQDLNSIKGKNILENEFGIGGTGYVLIKDQDTMKIKNLVDEMEAIEGIKQLVWLGTAEDIFKPEDFMDENIKKEFLSGNANLIQVFFDNPNDSLETVEGVEKIQSIIGDEGLIGGPAALSADMQDITSKEVIYYSVVAFVIISIVLLISLESFIEPILFFITIGVAIVLNMGTNIIFDSISYTTHSVASIIQLAVSMDYSIFLLHRYMVEKRHYEEREEAMAVSIRETLTAILSSSTTTIAGFLALVVMKYTIGRDIGLVLAKGVFFSLVSVITLLPILILILDNIIEKYKHRILLPRFKRCASFVIKRRHQLLLIAILIAIPAYLAQSNVEYYYGDEGVLPKTSDSTIAMEEIDELFSNRNQLALILPKGEELKEVQLINELREFKSIGEIRGLYSMVDLEIPDIFIPEEVMENFQSENYSLINLDLNLPLEGKVTQDELGYINERVSRYYDEWYLTGESAIYADLQETTSKDFRNVAILSVILIAGIILIAFKSISIPIILVFIIQLGIWINLAIPYMQGTILNFISFIIIGAIQLGATVDYAILYTSSYMGNLKRLGERKKAAAQTIEDTGRAVLTSALILFTATFSVYMITSMTNAKELTLLIGRGAMISLVLVLMVLPALLIVSDRFIRATTVDWPKINSKGRE